MASAVSTYIKREKSIVYDVPPALCSTMSKQVLTSIKKALDVIAPFCFDYDVELRNVIRDHKMGAIEHMNGNVNFFGGSCPKRVEGLERTQFEVVCIALGEDDGHGEDAGRYDESISA